MMMMICSRPSCSTHSKFLRRMKTMGEIKQDPEIYHYKIYHYKIKTLPFTINLVSQLDSFLHLCSKTDL